MNWKRKIKVVNLILSILVGGTCLVYDVWMIQNGRFPTAVMIGLAIWVAVFLLASHQRRRGRTVAMTDADPVDQSPK